MTKKDYILIAKVIRSYLQAEITGESYSLTTGMADILKNDNPKFNRERFYQACQPK